MKNNPAKPYLLFVGSDNLKGPKPSDLIIGRFVTKEEAIAYFETNTQFTWGEIFFTETLEITKMTRKKVEVPKYIVDVERPRPAFANPNYIHR